MYDGLSTSRVLGEHGGDLLSRHVFFFKQKTAYEMRISDWSSDVCSSDLAEHSRGDHSVIHQTILLGLEQASRHCHAFSQGDRRELYTTDNIAEDRKSVV